MSYHAHTQATTFPLFSFLESLAKLLSNFLLWDKESQPLWWQCCNTLLLYMEHTKEAARGSSSHQSCHTMPIPRPPRSPFFPSWRVLPNFCQIFCCGTRRANHCGGSVAIHCYCTWNTLRRQQEAVPATNHVIPCPYPGHHVPPFFLPGESCQTFVKFSVVGQGEPTIVVAVFQYIARVHGTHQGGSKRQF